MSTPAGTKPYGRWCEKCEKFVPAHHRKDMLMKRKPNHNPVILFVRVPTTMTHPLTW